MLRPGLPLLVLLGLAAALPAMAQQSASYRIEQHALNAGGVPSDGEVHTSASYAITLESIAGPVGSFVVGLLPPSEVTGLLFTDVDTLVWDGHPAAGQFRLYRDDLSATVGPFGDCLAPSLPTPTADDPATPSPGSAFVYLVNVANTLGEEGSPGASSAGAQRILTTVCP